MARKTVLLTFLLLVGLLGGACGAESDDSAGGGDPAGGGAAVSESGFEFGQHCFAFGTEDDDNFGKITITYNGDDDIKAVADELETDDEGFQTPRHYELTGTKDGETLNLSGQVTTDNQDTSYPVDATWTWNAEGLNDGENLYLSSFCES